MNIGIACYRRDQWELFLDMADDRDKLEKTWEDWRANVNRVIKNLKDLGKEVEEIEIDLNDLANYCKENNLPNTTKTRSKYVADLLSKRD